MAEGIDTTGDGKPDEGSLRGSSTVVAERIRQELQAKVKNAGIEILECASPSSLRPRNCCCDAPAARRAIIDARKMIVEGAVSMVEMALEQLNENDIVQLDEERKAAMVSNLLVILCGNKDAQPVVNSGSLY